MHTLCPYNSHPSCWVRPEIYHHPSHKTPSDPMYLTSSASQVVILLPIISPQHATKYLSLLSERTKGPHLADRESCDGRNTMCNEKEGIASETACCASLLPHDFKNARSLIYTQLGTYPAFLKILALGFYLSLQGRCCGRKE